MSRKENLIYIMHVDWNWIKQRPHFLAEELNKYFNVKVLYQYRYGRKGLQKRDTKGIDIEPIYVIPRGDRYRFLRKINFFIKKWALKREISKKGATLLYLTLPDQINWIPEGYNGRIIYDCMDNHPAFLGKEDQKEMIANERTLIGIADVVLVSSNNLIEKLVTRYGESCRKKLKLVRNGYNGELIDFEQDEKTVEKEEVIFSYFGTISNWFNFEYILKCLEDNENVVFEIYGPIDGVNIPEHSRLIYKGTVEHHELQKISEKSKCLIMPFLINEIIEAVDPVKLYEYINFNKNILCCRYNEIERFDKFVYFYNTYEEFNEMVKKISKESSIKYTNQERIEFLRENSWEVRGKTIQKLILEE